MKALLYLIGLIAVGVLVAWFGFGIHPQNQWQMLLGYTSQASSSVSEHFSDTSTSAKKLGKVLDKNFDEAAEVYHGKIEADSPDGL